MFKNKVRFYIILGLIVVFLGTILSITLLVSAIKAGVYGHVPDIEEIQKHKNFEETRIFASGGELIGTMFSVNRSNVPYSKIPSHVINALIATEDARFFEHDGVDFIALSRVLAKSVLLRSQSSGGGSTISQQLAKNLYGRAKYSFFSIAINKIREMIIASRIEKIYTKEEILCLYLNTVSFGDNVYGIENAALRYFSVHCSMLSIDQAAVLIGILKANTLYNPRINAGRSIMRRNTVMQQMVKYGYLNSDKYNKLSRLALRLKYQPESDYKRKAGYFIDFVQQEAKDIIEKYNRDHSTNIDILTDGLKIETTLDFQLQQAALQATNKHIIQLQRIANSQIANSRFWKNNPEIINKWKHSRLQSSTPIDSIQPMNMSWGMNDTLLRLTAIDSFKYANSRVQAAVFATDPRNGAIKVWIGGVNYITAPYNRVLAKRQVGSTFKPIVYYTALAQGIEPCEQFKNERETYSEFDDWSPGNADNEYGGFYSMKGGLANSVNTITAKVFFKAGLENVITSARQMGITADIPEAPSIALGIASISLYEMVKAYATIANKGYAYSNYAITKITDSKGKVLYQHFNRSLGSKLEENICEKLIDMMEAVADSGTARRLRDVYGFNYEVACKTGTTQDNTDGWFIGATPKLSMGVWVGFDNPAIHFQDIQTGQGANTSLPIWAMTMNKAGLGKYTAPFLLDPENISDCMLYYPDRSYIRQERRAQRDSVREIKRQNRQIEKEERKIKRQEKREERKKNKKWWWF